MKRALSLIVCLLVFGLPASAAGDIEIGIKGGLIDNYSQSTLAVADYDINSMNMIGGQLYYSELPVIDVIFSADYSWKKQTYTIADQGFEFKIRDLAVTASAVYPVKLSYATPYIGGGIGSHSLSYEYLRPVSLSLADNGVEIPETSTFFGYHGIVGFKFSLPALPLGFFVEARFNRINTPGNDVSFNSYTGGLYMALP